jgi:hypothetical protein
VYLHPANELLADQHLVFCEHAAKACVFGDDERHGQRHRARGRHTHAERLGSRRQLGAQLHQIAAQLVERIRHFGVGFDRRLLKLGGIGACRLRERAQHLRRAGGQAATAQIDEVKLFFDSEGQGFHGSPASGSIDLRVNALCAESPGGARSFGRAAGVECPREGLSADGASMRARQTHPEHPRRFHV